MKKLDHEIQWFITKYPFVTDPIVLFNPKSSPTKKDFLNWELNLDYSDIRNCKKNIDFIKKDFYKIINILQTTKFETIYLKIEYSERMKDFYKVLRIIEIFDNDEEYEKYNLINEYFWIDFKLLDKIFLDKDTLTNEFSTKKAYLSKEKIEELNDTFIKADEIKLYFDEALMFLWLNTNWKVVVWDVVSIVHTNFNRLWWEIIIPKKTKVSIRRLLALIAHEIDGHCIQFTNCTTLSSWWIRYSKSESLAEWFAIYNEYYFINRIFWDNKPVMSLIKRNKHRFDLIENKTMFDTFVNEYVWSLLRSFRWFSNISKYKNLKDFVYIQGLYNVIVYRKKYNNFFELIKWWAVNNSYINKYWIQWGRKEVIKVKNTSAYYILNKYFNK